MLAFFVLFFSPVKSFALFGTVPYSLFVVCSDGQDMGEGDGEAKNMGHIFFSSKFTSLQALDYHSHMDNS